MSNDFSNDDGVDEDGDGGDGDDGGRVVRTMQQAELVLRMPKD